MPKLKNDTRLEAVKLQLKGGIEYAEKVETEFINRFKLEDSKFALDWSKNVFEQSCIKKEFTLILNALNKGVSLDKIITSRTRDAIQLIYSAANKSTSQTANLIKECELQAIGKFLNVVDYC